MNSEAYAKTLNSLQSYNDGKGDGWVWYYSRERKQLWERGATSGNRQYVREMYLDCDGDAILIKVKQVGNACHTKNKTCFFRKLK